MMNKKFLEEAIELEKVWMETGLLDHLIHPVGSPLLEGQRLQIEAMTREDVMTKGERHKIVEWFGNGMRDVHENRPYYPPSTVDIDKDKGPHPFTDWAYEQGRELARRILNKEAP